MRTTALITGSTSGIGKATALDLAQKGWKVIIHGRKKESCEQVVREITEKTGNTNLHFIVADLSDIDSVKKMAETIRQDFPELTVLINNAGTFSKTRILTKNGWEQTWMVNYLSRFFLTTLLLDLLKKNRPSRIIDVSGMYHSKGKIHFEDISLSQNYSLGSANNQSKLANILFTYKLARDLEGTGVVANTLHPGAVDTGSVLNSKEISALEKLMYRIFRPFFKSPDQGAETLVFLASAPEAATITGKYFVNQKPVKSSPKSYDTSLQEKLWVLSNEMVQSVSMV
ncbi:MAG: SDR family oxidoreductase [Bacteroidia bacterium]